MARRNEEMRFANSGPFTRFLDGRIGRSFVKPSRDRSGKIVTKSYSADSAENYTIESQLLANRPAAALALVQKFGREQDSSGRRPRRRGGRGRKKVTA